MSGFTIAELHEIPARDQWIPIRDHFGIGAFGVNAYRADEAGGQVISNHTEVLSKHEELYVVVEGHATFTVDGEAIDRYPGFRDMAQEDSDFEPVRDDPSIKSLVGGPR